MPTKGTQSSAWKGYVSFGLVSVPIKLYVAARSSHVAFHEIHRGCGTRVHQQLYCPYDRRVVSRDEIAMGYEIEKDRYVLLETSELKRLQAQSSEVMEILQFARLEEIDPIYFETSYFSVPEPAGARAYELLFRLIEKMDYAAIAKVTMHQREQVVAIRPYNGGLIFHTLYYPAEIREVTGFGTGENRKANKQEIGLAEQFARGLVKPFRPDEFRDEYQDRVMQLVESKSKGAAAPRINKVRPQAPVIDLMTALKKSLAARSKKADVAKPRRLKKAG